MAADGDVAAKPAQSENPEDTYFVPTATETPRRFNAVALGLIGAMVLALAVSVFFIFKFMEGERARDLLAWQVRLGIVADSRAAAVNDWISGNFGHMRELAENASLQLYMTDIIKAKNAPPAPAANPDSLEGLLGGEDTSAASEGYLRNLLVAAAGRGKFQPPAPSSDIAANVERAGIAGLGLVDAEGAPIVATPDMPPMSARIRTAVAEALEGQPAIIDMYLGADNTPVMGFALPVFGIQDEQEGAGGIGVVIGIKPVDEDLFRNLVQPGELAKSAETFLAREAGGSVEYLSPLKDGAGPLERTMAIDTPDLAAGFAVDKPGGFGTYRDYAGNPVLVVSRSLAGVPWVLVRKIDQLEALSETDSRLQTILIVSVLVIVGVTIAIFAVWRHGSSVRAAKAMAEMEIALERFRNMTKFMRVVTDYNPSKIIAVTGDGSYTFANKQATDEAGMTREDMMGKNMINILGPVKTKAFMEINRRVINDFEKEHHTITFRRDDVDDEEADDAYEVLNSYHVPLRGDRDYPPGVLMCLEDISEVTIERRRNEKMLRQLINTLVSVVDRRDPFSANHSVRVAEVAKATAEEMGCNQLSIKTVDIAGSLMNLGKLFISPDLLTKTTDLTPEERETLANTNMVAVELLGEVSFEGPVVKTIRQMREKVDGSGPLGLAGEDILETARILSVANAFVGMASARAYRAAMPFDKISDILMKDSGSVFERRVVTALINYLENRGGEQKWAHYRDPPAETAAE